MSLTMNENQDSDADWPNGPDDSDQPNDDLADENPLADEPANPSDSDPLTPKKIGRYEVVRQLGRGGFGFVYLANDPELHRQVAIKVPRWDRPLTANAIDRFLNEGKLLAQVDCPVIVSVHDRGVDNGIPYVVMQFIEGKTLSWLLHNKKFSLQRSVKILLQIAIALREAHKQTIVHRDFKPANVIMDSRNDVHLVDFGMALHDDLTIGDFHAKSPIGTPQFMSPEQIRGENHRIDGRTDIWAFGVTMYLMLSGRIPFRAESRKDLSRAICFKNPRPIRQLNDGVSQELERVCLRCMSKLMDERYQSMADLIDELKEATEANNSDSQAITVDSDSASAIWSATSVSDQSVKGASGNWGQDSYASGHHSAGLSANGEPVYYVPKGLRCFDENDHDFFLRLLPGPVDRLGIPDSIRFWTARVAKNPVDKVPIGIIYGPSGCGKTSFIRAGLIPRVNADLTTVYVNCTTTNLAALILENLGRALNEDFSSGDLATCLRKIRQQHGEDPQANKVFLVLDQFEQWLESCPDYSQDELTEALRQCDGDSIQAMLLVRDEYWMSTTSFMRCLEQRVEDGRNAQSLPLFDRRHARIVLQSYGRNVGALPPASTALNRQQERFVRTAVESISQNGNVLCVHLTILADMVADSEWGKTSFDKALGSESIGSAFMERHLSDCVRAKKSGWLPICESIFSELLPPTAATVLKAGDRSVSELKQAYDTCCLQNQFEGCLGYLSKDLKLIVEVESADRPKNGEQQHEHRYRLTHDFFVTPIRQWITRRRSRSFAGRYRARFDQLSEQFQLNRNKRYLPKLVEYLMFNAVAGRRNTTPEKREFMKRADRKFLFRGAVFAAILVAGSLVTNQVLKEREAREIQVVIFVEPSENWPDLKRQLLKSPKKHIRFLEDNSTSENPVKQLRSSAGLVVLNHEREANLKKLLSLIETVLNSDWIIYESTLDSVGRKTASESIRNAALQTTSLIAKCRLAALQMQFGDHDVLINLFRDSKTPDALSEFTDSFPLWHCSFGELCEQMMQSNDPDVLFGCFQSLAFVNRQVIPESEVANLKKVINTRYESTTDVPLMIMIEFCCRKLDIDIPSPQRLQVSNYRLPVLYSSNSLVRIPAGKFKRYAGIPEDQLSITRAEFAGNQIAVDSFFVSSQEVSVATFKKYVMDLDETDKTRKHFVSTSWWVDSDQQNTAVRNLAPHHIYEFLNWLSKQTQGRNAAYRKTGVSNDGIPQYEPIEGSNGFRLPTLEESEWMGFGSEVEVAFSWASKEYFLSLAPEKRRRQINRFQTNKSVVPNSRSTVRDQVHLWYTTDGKAPNRYGLYEVCGGVAEMCNDRLKDAQSVPIVQGSGANDYIRAFVGRWLSDNKESTITHAYMGFRIAANSD